MHPRRIATAGRLVITILEAVGELCAERIGNGVRKRHDVHAHRVQGRGFALTITGRDLVALHRMALP